MPDYSILGSNTFGAYVNGKLWVPKGRPSTYEANLDVIYDAGYKGGKLELRAHRKINDGSFEMISFGMDGVDHEGKYYWYRPSLAYFISERCEYESDPAVNKEGWLEITKLDLQSGIIAGKFEFTLIEPGCDTIRITDGRFDSKLF